MISKALQRRPILSRAFLVVVLPLLVALILMWSHYRGSLPENQYAAPFVDAHPSLSLNRDDSGVVTVDADNLKAAFFGLGLAHAQDRLWQMN